MRRGKGRDFRHVNVLLDRRGRFGRGSCAVSLRGRHRVARGPGVLPAVVVDGVLKSTGAYPAREQIAAWAGLEQAKVPAKAPNIKVVLPMSGGCCGGGSRSC